MIVDFKKLQREHPPIHIEGTAVEKVESCKFLGVHITDKLKWSTYTDSVGKKAQQRIFNLRRLKKFGLSPKTLTNFNRCTFESILSVCITAWYELHRPQPQGSPEGGAVCTKHTKTVVKKARQSLFPLRKLNIFGMGPEILKRFYSCNIESILTGCITRHFRG